MLTILGRKSSVFVNADNIWLDVGVSGSLVTGEKHKIYADLC